MKKIFKQYAILLVALFILGWGIKYLSTPAITLSSAGMWWFLFIIILLGSIGITFINFINNENNEEVEWSVKLMFGSWIATVAILVIMAGISIFSSPMFHVYSYQNRITIDEGDFSSEVVDVDGNLSIVDVDTARKLGDRTLASVDNAMWYDVDDEYNLIEYNGEYYRLSALNYGGYFKYNKAKNFGLPGYVLVNCKTQEAKFVKLDSPYFYSDTAYFGYNLKRHLRSQYSNYVFGKSFFEIDEDGKPYWITSIKEATVGLWSNRVVKSFIVTNAVTGDSTIYSKDELPEWIDHAFELDYLMDAVTDNLQYVKGYLNSVFSQTGVQKLSYNYKDGSNSNFTGYNSTITANGEVVFFTAVTPANKAESIAGFVQISPRTGKVTFFSISGAEESSAQAAAQSLTQNYGYEANYPTVINVNGIPTYFMMLKDSAGLVQRYSLVNIQNYTIAVEDPTLSGAIIKYISAINSASNSTEKSQLTGVVEEIYKAEVNGTTNFYFTLNGMNGLFVSSIENSSRQVFLKNGSKVTIEYIVSNEPDVYTVTKISIRKANKR